MLPTLRLFISSPGDVDLERKRTKQIIDRLSGEYRSRIDIDAYFWEYEPMRQQQTFQDQIPSTDAFDAVVCILWSRLGTPLTGPDGRAYASGTDYEVTSANEAWKKQGKPDLMIYWNGNRALIRPLPREDRERDIQELERLEAFVNRYLLDEKTRMIRGAFTKYRDLGQFEESLEVHLRKLIFAKMSAAAQDSARDQVESDGPAVTWHQRPYQGLQTFDFEHAPIFFGRTRAIGEVASLLQKRATDLESARAAAVSGEAESIEPSAAAFVLISARSGAGKSSLVRAGVLPLLVQPGGNIGLWRRVVFRPSETPAGGDLFNALVQGLTSETGLPEILGADMTTQEVAYMLRQNPQGVEILLKQALARASENARANEAARLTRDIGLCAEAGRTADVERLERQRAELPAVPARLVIVIDQTEELFTMDGVSVEMRRRFVQALAAMARSGWAWVICTMRSDYFSRCVESPELMELKAEDGFYDLNLATPAEISQMIRRPAAAAGLSFERHPETEVGLDEALRDAAVDDVGSLPLLEFTLDQLFERSVGGVLTWAAYREIGGLEGALATSAENVLEKLGNWRQETFDHVMGSLVTLGTGSRESVAHRRVAAYRALAKSAEAEAFVNAFIAARLFTADKDAAGEPVVSVAHEALLSRKAPPVGAPSAAGKAGGREAVRPWLWERLGAWVEANADFLRTRARVATSLRQWQDAGEDPGFLLQPGRPLLDGAAILETRPNSLSEGEQKYIRQSIETEGVRQRRRVRTRRLVTAVLAALALGATVGAWFGISGKRAAEEKARDAQAATTLAEQKTRDAQEATALALQKTKQAEQADASTREQLRQASLSDLVTARNLMARGQWGESVSYARRALEHDPANEAAARWLWDALLYGEGDRDVLPDYQVLHPPKEPKLVDAFAVYSEDGERVLAVSELPESLGSLVEQLDAVSGKRVGAVLTFEDGRAAFYSPDRTRILTVDTNGNIEQWDAENGHSIGHFPKGAEDKGASYSPDGTRVLAFSEAGFPQQYDAATGAAVGKPIGQPAKSDGDDDDAKKIPSASYSPDGSRILTVNGGGTVQQWNTRTGDLINTLSADSEANSENKTGAFYSDSGKKIMIERDGHIDLWDAESGEHLTEIQFEEGENWLTAQFSPDATRVLTVERDGKVFQWSADNGAKLDIPWNTVDREKLGPSAPPKDKRYRILLGQVFNKDAIDAQLHSQPNPVSNVLYSPDGLRIIIVDGWGKTQQWDATTGEPLGAVIRPGSEPNLRPQYRPDGIALVTGDSDGVVQQWPVVAKSSLAALETFCHGHDGWKETFSDNGQSFDRNIDREHGHVVSAAYSPDGKKLLTAGEDGFARQWNAANGEPAGPAVFQGPAVLSAAYQANGSRIVTLGVDIQQWNAATGSPVGAPLAVGPGAAFLACGPNDSQVAVAFEDNGKHWAQQYRLPSGEKLGPAIVVDHKINSLCYRPDGSKLLIATDDGLAQQWEAATGQPGSPPLGKAGENSDLRAQYRPDGKRIILLDSRSITQWDTATQASTGPAIACEEVISGVAYSPDGETIAAALGDVHKSGVLRRWEAGGGRPVGMDLPLPLGAQAVAYSPDGVHLLVTGWSRQVTQFDLGAPLGAPPPWLDPLIQALSGRYFVEGELKELELALRMELLAGVKAQLTASPTGEWAALARWALLPALQRPTTPHGTLSLTGATEHLAEDHTNFVSLLAAYRQLPSNPLAQLAVARLEDNEERREFVRQRVLKNLPTDAYHAVEAATLLYFQGQNERAQLLIHQRVSEPYTPEVLCLLANLEDDLNHREVALQFYERRAALPGMSVYDQLRMGYLSAVCGRGPRAREIFSQARKQHPDMDSVCWLEGCSMLEIHAYEEAANAFSHGGALYTEKRHQNSSNTRWVRSSVTGSPAKSRSPWRIASG